MLFDEKEHPIKKDEYVKILEKLIQKYVVNEDFRKRIGEIANEINEEKKDVRFVAWLLSSEQNFKFKSFIDTDGVEKFYGESKDSKGHTIITADNGVQTRIIHLDMSFLNKV